MATADQLRAAAQAPNTRIAYAKGWNAFRGWCSQAGVDPLAATPEDVSSFFVTHSATLSLGTLTLYRSAIKRRYKEAKRDSPTDAVEVADLFRALGRELGSVPRKVRAVRDHQLIRMLACCPDKPIGLRDAAVLAVGFAAALRRSELCALRVSDIQQHDDPPRMLVRVRRSKTDQAGVGQDVPVLDGKRIRPVTRLRAWIAQGGHHGEAPLFQTMTRGGRLTGNALHHDDVARLVKAYVGRIGLDPKDFAAHSLRAGFVTSAAAHHARIDKIMEVTRHKSPTMVMHYVRDAESFDDHAGAGFL